MTLNSIHCMQKGFPQDKLQRTRNFRLMFRSHFLPSNVCIHFQFNISNLDSLLLNNVDKSDSKNWKHEWRKRLQSLWCLDLSQQISRINFCKGNDDDNKSNSIFHKKANFLNCILLKLSGNYQYINNILGLFRRSVNLPY